MHFKDKILGKFAEQKKLTNKQKRQTNKRNDSTQKLSYGRAVQVPRHKCDLRERRSM